MSTVEPRLALGHEGAERFDRRPRRVAQIDRSLPQHDAAARDARDVEQVVEQPRHVVGLARDDRARLAAGVVGPLRVVEHAGGAEDRGQRIAQLVRQHRQELLAPPHAVLNLLLRLAPLGDVEERHDRADHLVAAEDRMAPVLGRERRAVGAPEHFVLDVRPSRCRIASKIGDCSGAYGVPSGRVW